MKKFIHLVLFGVIALSVVGFTPRAVTAAASPSLADLMPANVALYADLRTANLDGTIGTFTGLLTKAGIAVPKNIYASIDQGLTQSLGSPITVKKDILPWLGDHIAVGVVITDAMIDSASKSTPDAASQPQAIVIVQIKDEAAADKFLKTVLTYIGKQGLQFTTSAQTLNGNAATVYSNPLVPISLVRTQGYLVLGNAPAITDMIATLNAKKPTLSADAAYQKTIGLLKPDNGAVIFFGARILQYQAAVSAHSISMMNSLSDAQATPDLPAMSATADATSDLTSIATAVATAEAPATQSAMSQTAMLASLYKVYNGFALALRSDGKLLAIDFAISLNPDAMKTYYAQLGLPADTLTQSGKALTGSLAAQIPSTATAVIYASNLGGIYTGVRTALVSLSKYMTSLNTMPGLNVNQTEQGFTQLEQGLQDGFNLDMKTDILSWTGGEFALYMNYDKTGDLAVSTQNQFPFDSTLLIAATDTTKAKSFVDRLNSGLTANVGIKPVTVGTELFTVQGQTPVRVGYGVTNDTFILSTGSGLTPASDAVKGKDTLSSGTNGVWKRAFATLPTSYSQFLYLDLTQVATYLKAAVTAQPRQSSAVAAQTKQALALFDEFESAVIFSGTYDNGSIVGTYGLLLK